MDELVKDALGWTPHPIAISAAVTFTDWAKAYTEQTSGFNALDRLEKLRKRKENPDHPFSLLVFRFLSACYLAANFDPKDDPGRKYRKEIASNRNAKDSVAGAARKLRTLLKKNERLLFWVTLGTSYSLRKRNTDGGQRPDDNLLGLLAEIESLVEGEMPELDGGPFLHRRTYACLYYNVDRALKSAPSLETALLFNLVFFLRKWTAHGTTFYSAGEKMPKDGRACYAVAASFVNATFEKEISDRAARTMIESIIKLGNPGLMHWPNEIQIT